MKKQIISVFLFIFFILGHLGYSQNTEIADSVNQVTVLFGNQNILPLKLGYSNKEVKKNTNDSTYIKTNLSYEAVDGSWKELEVELRARGFFRLNNCYFPPIKVKINKSASKGSLFEGNKKLKLVLPCLVEKDNNDNVVKEYLAYKLYEFVSPYHYNTRIVDLTFTEEKGKKIKTFTLKGILVEDDKLVAKRFDGKVVERKIPPASQDALTSVQNAFFQYMISNIDYSTYMQHNEKLLYIDKKIIPMPYDFDMSGLVNASYAQVSAVDGKPLVWSVRERLYRGIKRDLKIIQQVRNEFLANKVKFIEIVDSLEPLFDNADEFSEAKVFLSDFFKVMNDDELFKKEIIDKMRS